MPAWNRDRFYEIARAFQESRILLTAIELDLFSSVGSGADVRTVANRRRINPRATETLLNALAAMGLLRKRGDRFFNTPFSTRHLCSTSPSNERLALMHLANLWDRWSTLTACVRKGTAVALLGSSPPPDRQQTEAFIAAMHSAALQRAPALIRAVGARNVRRLLDVGGGSAAYSIAFAKANPTLHAVVLDRPVVLRIARRHIREAGLSDRIRTVPGDLKKDPLGSGFDLVLLSAICHMLSPAENLDLFRRCLLALVPQGRIVIRDFVLNPQKTAPLRAAIFSLNMLVNTPAGASYSISEYRAWLRKTGFHKVRRIDLGDPGSTLVIAEKPPT